ncbi:MAG: hypothetical protein Kow00107_10010 [Planctomycetota bacterium]
MAQTRVNDFESAMIKATALSRLGRAQEALTLLKETVPSGDDQRLRLLLAKADVLQAIGRHAEVRSLLFSDDSFAGASPALKAELYLRMGEFHQMFNEHEDAMDMFRTCAEAAQNLNDRETLFMCLEAAGESLRVLEMTAESDSTLEKAAEYAVELARESEDPAVVLRAAENIAINADPDEAVSAFERAMELCREKELKWDEGHILLARSRFEEFQSDSETAIMLTKRAISLFREMKSLPALLAATDQLASQYVNADQLEEAVKALETIVQSSSILGDDFTLLNTIGKCCQLCFEYGEIERALEFLKQIIEISAERNLKPTFVVGLLREAYRRAGSDLVTAHLGSGFSNYEEEEYDL